MKGARRSLDYILYWDMGCSQKRGPLLVIDYNAEPNI